MLAEIGFQDLLDELIASIGGAGPYIQAIRVWFSCFMDNLVKALTNMDADSALEVADAMPEFVIEAIEDCVEDLCPGERDLKDDFSAGSCTFAQMVVSQIGSGSQPAFLPKAPYFKTEDYPSGRNKIAAAASANGPKAIAEFFSALSEKLEHAAQPKARSIAEKLSGAVDAIVGLLKTKRDAVVWVAQKTFGLFGGRDGEEQEEAEVKKPVQAAAAFCKLSVKDNLCLNLADGRVGEFFFNSSTKLL